MKRALARKSSRAHSLAYDRRKMCEPRAACVIFYRRYRVLRAVKSNDCNTHYVVYCVTGPHYYTIFQAQNNIFEYIIIMRGVRWAYIFLDSHA